MNRKSEPESIVREIKRKMRKKYTAVQNNFLRLYLG